jgi:phosphonate transport system permease protein
MVGFVGAGGIGDALHTAISLFHVRDLTLLLIVLLSLVALVDLVGDRLRARLLATPDRGARCAPPALTPSSSSGAFPA